MLEKNEEIEQPIPSEWREVLALIVEDIRRRGLKSKMVRGFECEVDSKDVNFIYENVDAYGDTLTPLPDDAWRTSICRWMGRYWQLLIDLFTDEEGQSDLVLFVDAYENGNSYRFQVRSVHVP